MYMQDILWGISRGPFGIPFKISNPYAEKFAFYAWNYLVIRFKSS